MLTCTIDALENLYVGMIDIHGKFKRQTYGKWSTGMTYKYPMFLCN